MKEINKFNKIIDSISSELENDLKDKQQVIFEILYLILKDKEFTSLIHKGK